MKKCAICGHKDEVLRSRRHLLELVPQDVWVQRDRSWVVCKAGSLLCLDHPRLLTIFKPTEAMTPSNPRWKEFTEALEMSVRAEGCNAGRDKSLATSILKVMGFHKTLIDTSLAYFESHGGFCDCEIIYNIGTER